MLAIASLFFAVVLWLQIQPLYNPDRERELSVPLTLRNLPPGLVAVQAPETVRVIVSGTAAELEGVDSSDFMASMDMTGARPGAIEETLAVSGPQRPSISARAARPTLTLQLARLERTSRLVTLETTGVPSDEFLYENSAVEPETVTLVGADVALARVDRVRVLLDLSQIQPKSQFTLNVETLDNEGRPVLGVESEPATVRVSPAVGAAPTVRQALVNPVFSGQLPVGVTIESYEINPIQVTLTGPSTQLARVSKVDTQPISLAGITETTTRQAGLVIPPGMRASGPRTVQVRIVVSVQPSQPPPTASSPTP